LWGQSAIPKVAPDNYTGSGRGYGVKECGLKGFEVITYATKVVAFFSGSPLIRTLQLNVLAIEKSYDR